MIKYFCDNCEKELGRVRYRDTELLPMPGFSDSNFAIILDKQLVNLIICEDCKKEIGKALCMRKHGKKENKNV